MKKLLLSFVVLPGALAIAQVGINTEEPQAMLDISAKEDQKGDLRIEDVDRLYGIEWILTWDENEQKVKRISISDLKWDEIEDKIKEDKKEEDKKEEDKIEDEIKYIAKRKIDYIRKKQPDRADEIFNKIKQCTPQNIVFDKHFGDGKHDFVYCATTVTGTNYNKTWLNLNLGAEYANINSPHFDPTVKKTGTYAHREAKTYGSLYQWQRASDGHEFRDSETVTQRAPNWTDTGVSGGSFITAGYSWVENVYDSSRSDLTLWQAGRGNNPCPSGYHVPTKYEWQQFYQTVGSNNSKMWRQDKLPNLAAAGARGYENGKLMSMNSYGLYWSSSVGNNWSRDGYNMRFSSGSLSAHSYPMHAYGYSVRCIKD